MKRIFLSFTLPILITTVLCGQAKLMSSGDPGKLLKQQNPGSGFIENKGQIIDQNNNPNQAVVYLLNTPGMNVQLRSSGWSYDVFHLTSPPSLLLQVKGLRDEVTSIQFHRIDLDLVGSNPHPTIETSAPSSDYLNYYTTGTPAEGVTGVRSFTTVTYKNIYPGIDLQFISDDRTFEYNFILQPGADINLIKLKVVGPQKIKSYREGLHCETSLGDVDETIPVCYYSLNDIRVPVKGRFKKIAEHFYGFAVDQNIPSDALLVIDPIPTRRWGTFYGGTLNTAINENDCVTDGAGNVIVAGNTSSVNNIATTGAYQLTLVGHDDAFLVKFFTDGQRQWGTYYGGSSGDNATCCTVDRYDNIIFAGGTGSPDNIATPGAYQTVIHGQQDGMLVKFTPGGQRIWGTYYGGNETSPWGTEQIQSCAVDTNGNIYFAGVTNSPDYITSPGAHQTIPGGKSDAFLVKFTADGQRAWGTYYGGSELDQDGNCTVSKNGFVFLSGNTNSPNNIATPGSFMQTFNGAQKTFLAAFNPDGQRLWGTYYAGEFSDWNYGCVADTGSNVYIFGTTSSITNIATPGAFQETGVGNGYLAKFNSDGQRLWGTYYGEGGTNIYGAAVDDSANIFICGNSYTQNTIIAPPGAFQSIFRGGPYDAFLAKFNNSGTNRIWGTYYGGTGQEPGLSCAADKDDNIYLCGNTWSQNNTGNNTSLCSRSSSYNYIATSGSFQTENMGNINTFLVKFSDCYSPDTALHINGPDILCQNSTGYVFTIDPIPYATDYSWCVTGDLTISSGQHTTSVTVDVGSTIGPDTISVYGINSCDNGFPKLLLVNVVKRPTPTITGNTSPLSGSTQTYSTETGKTNYQWTFSPGGTLVSGGGVNDPTITIQWNTSGAQWVRVNYTDEHGCVAPTPTQLDIFVTATVTIDFTSPDTVCIGEMITINDLSQGATTYYWNFCSGNANNNPTGVNIGNPGALLSVPTYITLVKQNDSCFSFISCQGLGVIRYYHGSSFANNPVSWTNLGQFGMLGPNQEGIQVKNDNGNWYGFVNNNTTMIRLNFRSSPMNMPTATNLGPFPSFNMAHGLVIVQQGSTWIGFVTCSTGQKLIQLNFGNSLSNIPVATDFGSLGGVLTAPAAICLVQENTDWYAMILAGADNLARITFGNSLLNVPTAVNLGNPGGFNSAGGLTLLRDCSSTTGNWTNYLVNGQLGKLTFPTGILGTVTGTVLGNIGGLNHPHSFSEIFRQNDTLFAYITDRGNGTLTRLAFPPCTNASVLSSTLFNPPPFSYDQPGTYNIHLMVDEGLPTMGSMCRQIVVLPLPIVNLGPDRSMCPGGTSTFDAGPGNDSYLWSTGATTQTIVANTSGTYWAEVTKNNCTARDTVVVLYYALNPVNLGLDTTVCQGVTRTFDAGPCPGCTYQWGDITTNQPNIGSGQTYTTGQAGEYMVTTTDIHGCLNRDTVQFFVNPGNPVSLSISSSDNNVCAGTVINFLATAGNPGTLPVYQWKVNGIPAGTNSPVYTYTPLNGDQVICILTSNVSCSSNNPASSNTIVMVVDPILAVTVSISASSNPFCLGTPVTFTATPGSGGLTPSYQWFVNGNPVGPNSNTFIYNPVNGDQVYCILTSSEQCTSNNPASSNSLLMVVNTGFPANVSITASSNPFCPGTPVAFTANPINGGPAPSYQWKVNGSNVGINSDTYSYESANGDSVRCIMTSNLVCVTGNPVSSTKIIMITKPVPVVSFTSCFDTITTINAKPIKLKGGIPLGGTYSGPGVNSLSGYFNPALAGVGMHTITYSYTNVALCSANASVTIVTIVTPVTMCGNPITDVRDNKVYQTVQIGTQCWLAEDLNYGTEIPDVQDQRDNCIAEKYSIHYSPLTTHSFYQWDEVMQYDDTPAGQGFCPPGWHIPTENDWNILFATYVNSGFAGSPLKYSGYSGFNALLSGARLINRGWDFQGFATFFWSSTARSADKAWAHGMNQEDPSVSIYPASRVNAFSVRCLKD